VAHLPQIFQKPLVRLLSGFRLKIRSGPNAGMRWTLASSGRGYVAGTFEQDRVSAIVSLLRSGDVFWDIGAHQGYVTLAASRVVGAAGSVVSFEPAASNRALLESHVRWNRLSNVRVLPYAVSDTDGEAAFGGTGGSVTFGLGRGDEVVATRSIRSLIENESLPRPSVLKIDVEGSEADVLRGGIEFLSPGMVIWISVHGHDLHEECRELVSSRGMQVFESVKIRRAAASPGERWGSDKEMLAVGSARHLTPEEMQVIARFTGVA
jgi:FkbM family methyltransferase